ncbi:MAG: PAS domain-containing protein [Rhodothermaceae bacterium]|nr:PAS domain-containing protein [Rhodothermaceae bacterium]
MPSFAHVFSDLLRPPSVTGPDWREHAHLYLLRLSAVLCTVLIPAFGVMYRASDPGVYDPFWIRGGMIAGALGVLALSFTSAWARRHAAKLLFVFSIGITASFAWLVYLNRFAPDYAIGFFFVWIGVAMFVSLAFDQPTALTLYIGISLILTVAMTMLVPEPGVNPAIYIASMLSAAVMVYVAVSARIQLQEVMEEREAHLAEAQQTANLGNWEVELESGRVYWSAEMFRIAGLEPSSGAPSFEAFAASLHFDDRALFFDFWDRLRHGREVNDLTLRLTDPDGQLRSVRLRGAFEAAGPSRRARLYGICLDVTAEAERTHALLEAKEQAERSQKQAEHARAESEQARLAAERARAEAEEMAQLKSAFLANMSHEIRTPLTAIIGFAQVLGEEVSPAQRDLVAPIEQSGKRLLATLNSVLDLARLKSEGVQLHVEPVDVAEEAHDLVMLLQPMAQEKGLALMVHAPVQGLVALADRSALHRVLTNLLSNAIKFTDTGRVMLSVKAEETHIRIRVRDTGRGISAEFLPQLFEEFRQESTGTTRSHEGSGLGLAITRGLVELMGGTITVQSAVGEGTLFSVHLPRPNPSQPEKPSAVESFTSASVPASGR